MDIDSCLIKLSIVLTIAWTGTFFLFRYSTIQINNKFNFLSKSQVAGIEKVKQTPTQIAKDIPIPQDSKIVNVDSLTENEESKQIITIERPNNDSDIGDFYKRNMRLNKWEEISQNVYAKGNRQLHINIGNKLITITILTRQGN